MASNQPRSLEGVLKARVTVPDHVVHRSFASETVVLNLETGRYHGLNPTAGRMLEVLEKAPNVGEAVGVLAGEYGRPADEIEADVAEFCQSMVSRGLIQLQDAD
jgi:hypothetical protein